MRLTIVLGLFVLVLRGALAQAQPDVTEILKKVSATYTGVSEYELVGDATGTDPRTGKRETSHIFLAFKGPNQYRMEGAGPGMSLDDSATGGVVMGYDGSVLWFYQPKSNQYGSFPGSVVFNGGGDGQDLMPKAMDNFVMSEYRSAGDLTKGTRFLREEAIEVAGAKIDCYVVSITDRTWWVNKKNSRVVREDRGPTSTVFTSIKLGEPLPDSLFKFEPPPGAKKIEQQ